MHENVVGGPYAHTPRSVKTTMVLVMLALVPATALGMFLFGWPAFNLWLVTIAASVLFEAVCLNLAGKPIRRHLADGSAVLTGWLLAMMLPPWAPWWIGVVGAAIAIVVGKHAFGGIGQNLFNPAIVGRVALLVAFPLEMSTFVAPTSTMRAIAPGSDEGMAITFGSQVDAVSAATPLSYAKTEVARGQSLEAVLPEVFDHGDAAIGLMPGSLGETSFLLLLLGGLFLLRKRVFTWHVPVATIGTLVIVGALFHGIDPGRYVGPLVHVLSGATMLGAFFIATDPVTSPVTSRGQLFFGMGCGLLTFVIRTWASYPEGFAFAIILMNAATPLIDRYVRPRVYGRTRAGVPITYSSEGSRP